MKNLIASIVILFASISLNAQYKHDSIKIEHGYLHYYTKGKGEPIVFLQGGPGFSSYYMRAIADSLSDYKTILIDFEGTGRSQYRKVDTSWVSMDNTISNIELVRKKLGITDWIVLGHSYGGMLALHYAVKFPKIVTKVITIAGAMTDNKFQKYYSTNLNSRFTPEDLKTIKEIRSSSLSDNEKFIKETLVMTNAIFLDRSKAHKFISFLPEEELNMVMNLQFFNSMYQSMEKLDIGNDVYQLNTPIRIIQGRQDALGEALPVLLNERSKNSKLFFVERAAHAPWAEQPAIFFKVLKEYLKN